MTSGARERMSMSSGHAKARNAASLSERQLQARERRRYFAGTGMWMVISARPCGLVNQCGVLDGIRA